MQTILFPTDFSQNAANALDYAVEIAKLLSAKLILLYSLRRPYADPDTFITPVATEDPEQAEILLQQLVQKVSLAVPCSYMIRKGFAADEISDAVKEQGANLVIMGTEGAGLVPDTLVNSTTVQLIQDNICPVLAIPEHIRFQPVRKIAFAVDLELKINDAIVAPLLQLAQLTQAEIMVLSIVSDKSELSEHNIHTTLQTLLQGLAYSTHIIESVDVVESIESFIKIKQTDMLAVISRKRSFFESLFHSSVTRKLTLHTHIPLLVLTE